MVKQTFDIPTSIRGYGYGGFWLSAGLLLALLLWAAYSQLEAGAVAMGEVIPAGRPKAVQHLEGGIISEIHVKDGDRVRAGDTVMVLDAGEARAALNIYSAEASAREALLSRLSAERDGKQPVDGLSVAADTQLRLFEIRREALHQGVAILTQRILQSEGEVQGLAAEHAALQTSLQLAREELENTEELYKGRYLEKQTLFKLRSRVAEYEGALGRNVAASYKARQSMIETREEIAKLKIDWMLNVLNEFEKTKQELAGLREKIKVAGERLQRMRILAPQEGIVHGLLFTTVGGVIPPREVIMEIIPTTEHLVVEARISPDDIDVVRPGLPGHVRLTAYKYREHGTLRGSVRSISADTFKDQHTGAPYYKAEIEIGKSELRSLDQLELYPGMLASVEIVVGKRSALRYLLEPVLDSFSKAFRED